MSKMTMQDLADAVGVSRITVWKALTGRPGVSEAKRRLVQQKAAELGYHASPESFSEQEKSYTFALAVSRPESSNFWMSIIHYIAKELSKYNINLLYTYIPSAYHEGYHLPSTLFSEHVDGCIVLNIYDETLLRMLAETPIPTVFLDTVPQLMPDKLKGDLVLIDGRSQLMEITKRLLELGYRKLGFIGDVDYAQTNAERYHGFLDAHKQIGIKASSSLSLTGSLSLQSHYEEISAFLDSLPVLPDGFVCASDFIANFISRYLHETNRPVPERFILTGFDNNSEYSFVANSITTVQVDTASLGRQLARKMIFRADYPDAPTEVSYIRTDILWRGELAE
ncbi:MAG: LacI family DNA-binding transcriptional regulator [Clostridia bacterium]|nr:LacI family DNA-binding transcriptional regulator [Clostridia bacterium]